MKDEETLIEEGSEPGTDGYQDQTPLFQYDEDDNAYEFDPISLVLPLSSLCRPRALYSSIYALIGITGSRFYAPFLENLGLSVTEIGLALALQQFVMTMMGSCGKSVADALDHDRPGAGRAQVLCTGVVYSTLVYILNVLEYQSNICYILLAGLYTVGLALIFPVLDCMTTEYLECTSSNTKENFACERLYGALSWIFTNLYMACALDWFGFDCTYPMAAYSTFTAVCTVYMYTSLNRSIISNKKGKRDKQKGSEDECKSTKELSKDPNDVDKSKDDDSQSATSHTSTDMTRTTRTDSDSDFESVEGQMEVFHSTTDSSEEESAKDNQHLRVRHDCDASDVSSLGISLRFSDDSSLHSSDDESTIEAVSESGARVEIITGRGTKEAKKESEQENEKEENVGKVYSELWFAMLSSCYGCAFLFYYTTLCAGQSVVDNLAFLYFRDLGAPYLLMGYSVVITISMELPLVSSCFKCCGGNMMLVMAGLAFVVRVIGYTVIQKHVEGGGGGVWFILMVEPLHGLVYAGTFTAVADYVERIVPSAGFRQVKAKSMVYVMRGLGNTGGIMLAAFWQDKYGTSFMYRNLALLVLVAVVSFVLALGLDIIHRGTARRKSELDRLTPSLTISPKEKTAKKKKKKDLESGRQVEGDIRYPTVEEYLNEL